MASTATDLLEIVLRECARMAPQALYPGAYAQATGVDPAAVDDCLEQLRLAGLVRLTDWVLGSDQGYAITPQGRAVLGSTRLVQRLRDRGAEPPVPVLAPIDEHHAITSRGETVRAVLLAPARPAVTWLLIVANLVVFAIGLYWAGQVGVVTEYLNLTLAQEKVFDVAANDPKLVVETDIGRIRHDQGSLRASDIADKGQWWRLVTCAFVHVGALHLLMNMLMLISLGPIVEQMWGRLRYLTLYLIAAIGGAVTQLVVNENVSLAGASCSLCGMLTSMGVWVTFNRRYLPQRVASHWMRNIFMNIVLIALISFIPGVSWAGHLGGGVAGAIVAVPLVFSRFGRGMQRWLALGGVVAVPAVCVLLLWGRLFATPALPVHIPIVINPQQTNEAWTNLMKEMIAKDNWAAQLEEQHCKPFLRKKIPADRWDDPGDVAVLAMRGARDDFRAFAKKLANAPPTRNAVQDTGVKNAHAYLEAQVRMYDLLLNCITDNKNWTKANEDDLHRQVEEMQRLRKDWRDSPFLVRGEKRKP